MKIDALNKAFDNRIRLGIISALAVNSELNFNALKEALQVTDGNLASHLKGLEEYGYIAVNKGFIGRKPNTVYTITPEGYAALKAHFEALEEMIRNTEMGSM